MREASSSVSSPRSTPTRASASSATAIAASGPMIIPANGATSVPSATISRPRTVSITVTRPADSGSGPSPALMSDWKACSPTSHATCDSPVRSVTRASRGGSWRVKRSVEAARPRAGATMVNPSGVRATQ